MGYVTQEKLEKAFVEKEELSNSRISTILCPSMVEVIAEKI